MILAKYFASNRLTLLGGALTLIAVGFSNFEDGKDEKTWQQWLPHDVRASILWCADHEEGTLVDWEYDRNSNNGGGVFNTGGEDETMAETVRFEPFTGDFCAKTTILNAFESKNGNRAVRLMRWTDKPWDQGGKFFPDSAYYGVWMRLDHHYSIQNKASPSGGWWNLFQFKSNDNAGNSHPVWVLNVGNDAQSGKMHFYLYSEQNQPNSISQKTPVPIPVGRWFHVEALYQQSNKSEGSISIWQDGQLILAANNVKTILAKNAIWGIGNYTDHITGGIKPGSATVYFDDATISAKPTHPYVTEMLKMQRSSTSLK